MEVDPAVLQELKKERKLFWEMKTKLDRADKRWFRQDFYVMAKHPQLGKWRKGRILTMRPSKNSNAAQVKSDGYQEYYVRFENQDKRNDCWLTYESIRQISEPVYEQNWFEIHRQFSKQHRNDNPHYGLTANQLDIHQRATRIRNIETIRFGKFETRAWYFSPYPPMYQSLQVLYICEYCFSPFCTPRQLQRHDSICTLYYPPGNEIYRDKTKNISVFEVDGVYCKTYLQNLGYFAKLFLDHKCLYLAVKHFIFYILCEYENQEFHVVGYFSKCIKSGHNLSCILVLPFYQRKGYGKLLVNFSYQLSLVDKKAGSPEKPLSDLGRKLYFSYWAQKIIQVVEQLQGQQVTAMTISRATAIEEEDIKWTIFKCSFLKIFEGKIILLKSEESEQEISKIIGTPADSINRENLHYVPFLSFRQKKTKEDKEEEGQDENQDLDAQERSQYEEIYENQKHMEKCVRLESLYKEEESSSNDCEQSLTDEESGESSSGNANLEFSNRGKMIAEKSTFSGEGLSSQNSSQEENEYLSKSGCSVSVNCE